MSKKILAIDDERDVFETLSYRFESFGHEMIWAKNGTEGLEKAESWKPDLIFLDFTMPGENGLDILKKLKTEASEVVRKIPVVMLTGNEDYEKACMSAGASGYITKPFDPYQLKAVLSDIFKE
jgi:CheY-like chemotaxis protein